MTALEEVVASQAVAALPNFSNPAEAARAWQCLSMHVAHLNVSG
jgi:hypothetical protein